MSPLFKSFVLAGALALSAGLGSSDAGPTGHMEGHLTIVAPDEVALSDEKPSVPAVQVYAKYPLIILGQDGKEIARVTADSEGNYRMALPPGNYILDVKGRARGHARAKPQRFSVVSNRTVRVDLSMDTGVR